MKILVTGYKGFIGKNLCNYLLRKGHEVEGYEYVPNTIPDPEPYNAVIHLGAISSTTETNVELIMEQNYEFTMRLAQACDQFGVKFQYASSASVYGPTDHFTEDGPLLPQSPYAWSKYLFDRFVNQIYNELNVNVQGFRYFNVYGPFEEDKGDQASPVSKFTKQAKENGVIKLFKNSDQYLRDFVCVEDICYVHEQMLAQDVSGIFNIGTGNPVSFEHIAKLIANKYNANIQYIDMPDNIAKQYQRFTKAKNDKIKKFVDINWKTVEEYLNETTD